MGTTRRGTRIVGRQLRRRLAQLVAAGVGAALAATLLDAPPVAAAPEGSEPPRVQQTKSVTGQDVAPKRSPKHPSAAVPPKIRTTVWPASGSATVRLPAPDPRPAARAEGLPAGKKVQASDLPLRLGAGRSAPRSVRVEVLDRRLATRAGLTGVLLRLSRADDGASDGTVVLEFDYSGFASAMGGDWAARLRLVKLPDCAATTPQVKKCQAVTPIVSRNNIRKESVSAEVSASSVYAVAASASGGTGSYAATPLGPSSSWQVSTQTGDFSRSYPLRVPPGVNGPTPELTVNYSSGSVDGRTASTNNQPSWVGEGHSLETGYIERKYVSCSDDMSGGNNNTTKTGDLCWKTDNATLVLGGRSGELVKAADGSWRLENDDGSRIVRLTGASNGDNDGEYWRLTTTDGSRYYFGRTKRYAADTSNTNSTWTVPVFGNHSGEPCHASSYASSWCQQAWRWNVDYVRDPHDNTMTYFYKKESNKYGRNNNSAVSSYHRGGYLDRIEYGERAGSEASSSAPARVSFGVSERCIPTDTYSCDPSQLTEANAQHWPDVPYDQICTSSTSCPNAIAPAFFTRKRLTSITTAIDTVNGYSDVDSWALGQSFPDTGDETSAGLWLDSIQHTGKVGGSVALPWVSFTGVQLDNRVDYRYDTGPRMIKWRVSAIENESGGRISVNYSTQECVAGSNMPASPSSNTMRCFPVYWSVEGQTEPSLHYFHKYVVTKVVQDDRSYTGPDEVSTYSYLDKPAWHYDDNELVLPKYRTWGGWRGYSKVEVATGAPGQPQTRTQHLYLRGMDGDKLPDGATRDVSVTDSQGGVITDRPRANGFLRESITYNGASGPEISGTVNTPWISAATATSGSKNARLLGTARTRARTTLDSGGHRVTGVDTSFDEYGMPIRIDDFGDTSTAADNQCTRNTYVRNTDKWILANLSRSETVTVRCDATPSRPGDVLADERMYYDSATALDAPPTQGLLTKVQTLSDWNSNGPVYLTTTKATYDPHGRTLTASDALDRTTRTNYTPTTGGPVTSITTTNPKGHESTKTLNPAWGNATVEVDANGRRTDLEFDPVGRLTAVWLPGRSRADGTSPNMKFGYTMSRNSSDVVTTEELRNNGTYTPGYAFYDGWQRQRQTQSPAPGPNGGRVITDVVYDSHGWLIDATGPYYNNEAPAPTRFVLSSDVQSPAQVRTTYDGAGRPVVKAFRVLGEEKWRTTVDYGGDRVSVAPPSGTPPTTTITDGRGRTVALRQHHGATPSGSYDETRYGYTSDGKPSTVEDPAGNVWRYFYDHRRLLERTEDPDKGTTLIDYDDAGQVISTADARGKKLFYTHDDLGRRTEVREGSATGTLQGSWLYDTLAKGFATSHTRYVGADEYSVAVTGYDGMYRPTGSQVVIPISEGALAGTYSTSMTYNIDGGLKSMTLPAVPGLPNETMRYTYDSLGLPSRSAGYGGYVAGTIYSPYGEALRLSLGQYYGKGSWQSFEYETGTRRLERVKLDREGFAGPDYDARYTRDDAGNLTEIAEVAPGQPTETQCFEHDNLRRLKAAWTPASGDCSVAPSSSALGGPAPYWHSFEYDKTGNRMLEVRHATAASGTDTRREYTYPASGVDAVRPHALTSVTSTGPGGTDLSAYTYDDAGNTLTRPGPNGTQSLSWDAEGRLGTVSDAEGETSYVYDANGDRLIRRDPNATTLYLDGAEITLDRASGEKSSTRHYEHLGKTIAVRTSKPGSTVGTVKFLLADHHGTAEVAVDSYTQELTRRRFDPFGNPRGEDVPWSGERGFVGGTLDASTGLTHLGAREYDPRLGRFISVDPVIDPGDPQQMHGYAYANNSPASFSDPDGLRFIGDNEGKVVATPQPSGGYSVYDERTGTRTGANASKKNLERAEDRLNRARAEQERLKRKLINAGKLFLDILLEVTGAKAGIDCFLKGDVGGCIETAVTVISGLVGGVLVKIGAKYAFKWKAAARLAGKVAKLVTDIADVVKNWSKAARGVADAVKNLAKARKAGKARKAAPDAIDRVDANGASTGARGEGRDALISESTSELGARRDRGSGPGSIGKMLDHHANAARASDAYSAGTATPSPAPGAVASTPVPPGAEGSAFTGVIVLAVVIKTGVRWLRRR